MRKKRTIFGAMGAAPVSATRARRRPVKFSSARNTSRYQTPYASRAPRGRLAGMVSAQGSHAAMARSNSQRRSPPASAILMWMAECSFSQIRGTPRNWLGATSRKSSCTVRMDSPKFTVEPR